MSIQLSNLNQKQGFTLIELLIALGITAIAGSLLIIILIQNNGLFISENTKISQGLSLNDAQSVIDDAIRTASSVSVTCPTPPCTGSFSSASNQIVLKVPSLDESGLVIKDVYDYIVIAPDFANAKILTKKVFPDTQSRRPSQTQVLTTSLSLIQFIYLNQTNGVVAPAQAEKVNFILNLANQVGLNQQISSSSGQVSLRNY